MSLLRTTQSSRLGTERLSSYSQSRRENNAHPWSRYTSNGMPSTIDWAPGGAPSVSTHTMSIIGSSHDSTRRNSTDDELNSIVRNAATSMLGTVGESRDPTEESVPAMSKSSSGSSSSFSVTRAFGAKHNRYESPEDRTKSPSLPPRTGTQPVKSSSTLKSVETIDRSRKKIPVRKKMNLMAPSISVGKVEVQRSSMPPISPSPPMTASAKSRERYRKAISSQGKRVNKAFSLEEVSSQARTLADLDLEKEKDRQRATRLLNKVDESKQASLKVQQAREAAKVAIEKARRARAEKDKKVSSSVESEIYAPNNPFNDDLFAKKVKKVSSSVASEIYVPNNPFNDDLSEMYVPNNPFNDDLLAEKAEELSSSVAYDIPVPFGLLDDDSTKDSALDKYFIDAEADKYGQDDIADDVMDMAAGMLAPPKDDKYGQDESVDDVMDMAAGMLSPPKNLDEHYAQVDAAKKVLVDETKVKDVDCVTEICNLWDEEMLLLKGDGVISDTKGQAEQAATDAEAMAKAGESPIRSHVTFVNDTLAQPSFIFNEKEIDLANGMTWESSEISYSIPKKDPPTGLSRSESVDEIDNIMDHAAEILIDKPKQEEKHPSRPESKVPPLDDKEDDSTYKTENELDEIMNFAAGLLGRAPERKKKARPPNPPVPKEIGGKVQTSGGSVVDRVQSIKAVPQRTPASVAKAKGRGNFNQRCPGACSMWSDDFFCAPEEEVVLDSAEKQGNAAKSSDVPQGTEMGGKGVSLLATSIQAAKSRDVPQETNMGGKGTSLLAASMHAGMVHDKVTPKKSNRKPVPPPPEAFRSKAISTSLPSESEPISSPKATPTSPRSEPESILSPSDKKPFAPPQEDFSLKAITTSTCSEPNSLPHPLSTLEVLNPDASALADNLTEKSSPSVDFPNSIAQTKPTQQKKVSFVETIVSCPMISVLLDDESAPMPSPKAQRSEQQVVQESTCALPIQPKSNVKHSDRQFVLERTCAIPIKPKSSAQDSEQRAVQEITSTLPVQPRSNVQRGPAKRLESAHDVPEQPIEVKNQQTVHLESSSRGDRRTPAASEKVSKNEMTVLDSDDEFWDTLSSIASTKDFSIKRVSHPHPYHEHPLPGAETLAPVKPAKAAQPFGALLCNFWPTRHLQKQGEEEEHTLDSSEESLGPEIPREISYVISWEVEKKEKLEEATSGAAQALDKVDTLITKESDCSSESSVLFDMPSKNNSFQAEDRTLKLDEAITRGQEMAETVGASSDDNSGVVMVAPIGASRDDTTGVVSPRHGSDEGEEPLGSPSLLLNNSLTFQETSDSRPRKIADKKHPWSKRGPVVIPKAKSTPQLKEENIELAAALGIGPTSAPGTDEAEVALDTPMSRDYLEELSDLIMSLTRSNGDDEFDENNKYNPTQYNLQLQPRTGEVVSSSSSGEAEVMVLAQSNGNDEFDECDPTQLDSQLHSKPEEVVFSPSSNEVEVVLASPISWKAIESLEETAPDRHLLDIIGYVSPTQSYDDESEIIPEKVASAPSDVAVKKQSSNIERAQAPPDGDMTKGGEENYIAPVMNDLLSKYDTVIQMLLNEKRTSTGKSEDGDSHDVEIALEVLREERERVLGTSASKTPSPLRQTQETKCTRTQGNASPTRSRVQTDQKLLSRESASPPRSTRNQEFASRSLRKASPKPSPDRSSRLASRSRESASPTRSPRRSSQCNDTFPEQEQQSRDSADRSSRLASRSRESASPTRSPRRLSQRKDTFPEQEQQSRDSASPMRSPKGSTLVSRSFDGDSIARSSLREEELQSRLSWSPARSPRHQELALCREQLEKRRRDMSPTRSPSRRASSLQSRDVTPPTRSAGRQERVSPSRSPPRPMFARRARPRPEDMTSRRRSSRARSWTPVRPIKDRYYNHDLDVAKSRSFERRSRAEMREPEMVADVVRRIYSPKRQRERLFVEGDDYAEKSRIVREQLNLARRSCQSINESHEYLFDELQEFKRKLSRHSMKKDGERALISESRGALKDFHKRLEHVRKMRASGRDSPDTVDAVERALEEAWEDFDNVRRVMLANLNTLNSAKEELMRERLLEEEESDEEHLRSLERMMYEIREREHEKTEHALESLRGRRYAHGAQTEYGH